jgi:uncharacterized protein (UPF0371 family)
MSEKIIFDNNKYIKEQIKEIKKKLSFFNKIYIEIGGHLISDNHAQRIFKNYKKNTKLKIIEYFMKNIEIIYCIYSKHLEMDFVDYTKKEFKKKVYNEIKYLKNKFKNINVVITRYNKKNEIIENFVKKIEKINLNVYFTTNIKNYPNNIKIILGQNGYLKQPYIKTTKKIIIVTGHNSNSGKMSVCLSQIYLDYKIKKIESGYCKLETFPVWNLKIDHPINLAYEAATADLNDINMIDPYHKKNYNIIATNYNRDIINFKILKRIISKITSKKNKIRNYKSPTDMGINTIKNAIIDDDKIRKRAIQEIKRRYEKYNQKYICCKNKKNKETLVRIKEIIKKANIKINSNIHQNDLI